MRYCLGALAFAIPLVLLPNWSFYYDVTPKVVALLAGVAMIAGWSGLRPLNVETSWARRWNSRLAAGFGVAVAISAALSPVGTEAWIGSDWRRLGAIALLAAIAAGWAASQAWVDRDTVLRGIAGAGLLAGAYGIAQYFGWDPWLEASGYHFGEGAYQIVRPPGTMGHSNYLAAFLLWPVFVGAGLWRTERSWLGAASAVVSVAAIAVCGSRGAWIGLAAGALVWLWRERPSARVLQAAISGVVIAGAVFYLSPAGERLRARVFWIGEDSAGGSRLLLWRDSVRMALERPIFGYGPDAFAAEFPRLQSAELSRAFPDFYHESPHNLFLDALVGQGAIGMLLLAAWIGLGMWVAWRAVGRDPYALPVFSGLVATVAAHQFAVWIVPTAFVLLVMLGLAVRMEPAERSFGVPRWAGAAPCAAALAFAIVAFRFAADDHGLAMVRTALDQGKPGIAADQAAGSQGVLRADLYFSQRWIRESGRATTALEKLRFSQLAGLSAAAATTHREQQQNAWYNLAILQASANDAAGVERSLRAASETAPTWYKPHWTLSRVLWATGRKEQARAEARVAVDLNGGKNAEVAQTLEEILGSGSAQP